MNRQPPIQADWPIRYSITGTSNAFTLGSDRHNQDFMINHQSPRAVFSVARRAVGVVLGDVETDTSDTSDTNMVMVGESVEPMDID